ncbi:MAG: hypothetical protein EBX19_06100, partial [Actinobacteria bacterium]|nr:hypothetical protein [Actinomycetota bacterium]
MKRFISPLIALALAFAAITGVSASANTDKEARKAANEAKVAEYKAAVEKYKAALEVFKSEMQTWKSAR